MSPFRRFLTIAVASLVLDASAVYAAGSNIPSAEVVSLLRSANIIKVDYPIRAVMSGQTVTILTRRASKSSESDVKIDAMLIAKTLFDSYATQVSDVEVLFSTEQEPDAYSKIRVTQQQVKDFGAGKVTEAQILASLQVAHEDDRTLVPESQAELTPGPYLEQRLALQDQIQELQRGGTDTKPFQALFDQAEQSIKDEHSREAHAQLASLAEKLQEQVELRKAANVPILKPPPSKTSFGNGNGFGNHQGLDFSKLFQPSPPGPSTEGSNRLQAIVSRCLHGSAPIRQIANILEAAQNSPVALPNALSRCEQLLNMPTQYPKAAPSSAEVADAISQLMQVVPPRPQHGHRHGMEY